MTKTASTSATPGTEPPKLVPTQESAVPPETAPPKGNETADIEWTAFQFALAILSNQRGEQMLRLGAIYNPNQIGAELAIACWNMAASFTHNLAQLRHAHNNPRTETAQ